MKEIKIISGYKLKDPKFDKEASNFLWSIQKRGMDGKRKKKDWPHRLFSVGSVVHKVMFDAGVLGLYFEPVYKDQLYYIQNTDAGFMGNAVIFWAKYSRGYTCDLNRAEKFTFKEANVICSRNPIKNVPWPIEYIDENKGIQRVVDVQYLQEEGAEAYLNAEEQKDMKPK